MQADQRLGLFEWTLHQILLRHLRPQFEPVRPPQIVYYGLQQLGQQMLGAALDAGASQPAATIDVAFDGRRAAPAGSAACELLPPEACGLEQLDAALDELAQVAPKQRARLVDACAACICADAAVTVDEGELLRAICDMLDCPMPPLLPGQEVSPSLFAPRERASVCDASRSARSEHDRSRPSRIARRT